MAENDTSRCFTIHAPLDSPPLIQNGELTFQAHHVGWIISGFFTIIACGVSFWLISKHLMWYTKKREQRYIIRVLFMVPIYAIVSLGAYIFWNHAIPITLVRDSYESFVLHSFFYLLLQYLSPTIEGQKEVFRHVVLEKWMFPLGFVKYRPRDGLFFLQLMKWGILQYSVIRPLTTLAAVFMDFIGLYCESSWSPRWGYVYITVIVSISVSIAMYCLVQLYIPISEQLAPQKPLLKLFAVKAVVFLTFWQATGLSLLTMFKVVKDTPYMTADDINTGIAAILETFEMTCFAFLHVKAFSYRPYRPKDHTPEDQTPRLKSLTHAMDIRDMWREIRDGSVYMGRTIRGVEPEMEARRRIHFAKVMGRERQLTDAKSLPPKRERASSTHLNDDEYELLNERRSKYERTRVWISESGERFGGDFENEVIQELRKRDLEFDSEWDVEEEPGHARGKRSWWRGIYDRISQSGPERIEEEIIPRQHPKQRPPDDRSSHVRVPSLESPPPSPSVVFEYPATSQGYSIVRPSPPKYKPKRNRHHKIEDTSPTLPTIPDDVILPPDSPAPRTVSPKAAPRSAHRSAERLVSRSRELPPLPPPQNTEMLQVPPPQFNRADSLLGRVFAESVVSTEGAALSQDTHTTEMMFPQSLNVPSSGRRRTREVRPIRASSREMSPSSPSGPQMQMPSGRPRPNIVLPAPLSPARYPAREMAPGIPSPPSSHQGPQDASPRRTIRTFSPTDEHRSPRHLSAIQEVTPPDPRTVPELRPISESPTTNFNSSPPFETYPVLTNPTTSPPRRLRHTGGDIRRGMEGRS